MDIISKLYNSVGAGRGYSVAFESPVLSEPKLQCETRDLEFAPTTVLMTVNPSRHSIFYVRPAETSVLPINVGPLNGVSIVEFPYCQEFAAFH